MYSIAYLIAALYPFFAASYNGDHLSLFYILGDAPYFNKLSDIIFEMYMSFVKILNIMWSGVLKSKSYEFVLMPENKNLWTNSKFNFWTARCKLVPNGPPPNFASAPSCNSILAL